MAEEHRQPAEQEIVIPRGLCRRCVRLVSRRVSDVPGVVSLRVDAALGLLHVWGDAAPAELLEALRSAGFSRHRCGDVRR